MDVGAWVSVGCAMVAAVAAVAASLRDRSKDSDQHIDERIELAVGSRLTKIEATLDKLTERIPSRDIQTLDGQRIADLERRADDTKKDLDECFQRLRAVEQSCARQGHAS